MHIMCVRVSLHTLWLLLLFNPDRKNLLLVFPKLTIVQNLYAGFYFIRNNPLTVYFFGQLLKMGDLIASTKSHQAALASLLAEFVSWKGLRVKVWRKGRETLFPGGVEYHQFKDYMRKFIAGEIKPYIFHMSWYVNIGNNNSCIEFAASKVDSNTQFRFRLFIV